MTPNSPETVEQVREVASYRRKTPVRQPFDTSSVVEVDHAANVHDLATRIDTLQKSGSRVLVSVDEYYLKLSTVIRVAAPKPETPPKTEAPASQAAEPKRRRPTRRSASRG